MAPSVRVGDAEKARLDRLRTRLIARTGRKVRLQDLVGMLLDLAERRFDDLAGGIRPATAAQLGRLMALPLRTSVRTREADIDADLQDSRR